MALPIAGHRTPRMLLLLAAIAITGCSGLRGERSGVAIGEGRQQACQRACTAIGSDATPERCDPCNCDQLAGSPAICTTTLRRPFP